MSSQQMSDEAEAQLAFGVPVAEVRGQHVLHPQKEQLAELAETLKAAGYVQCVDLCAVDYLTCPDRPDLPEGISPERFELVAVFISHGAVSQSANGEAASVPSTPHRIRARVQVPESEAVVPSITSVYPGCENMEREAYDMFGIEFSDHPDLTRILMPDEWEGHPLRRDYAVGQVPVQFKGAPS